jgi:hypothetical protein
MISARGATSVVRAHRQREPLPVEHPGESRRAQQTAATGSGSAAAEPLQNNASQLSPAMAAATPPSLQSPWGSRRSDESPLTGETARKVEQLASAKVSGGAIVRVETDAEGRAAYEAHMTKADGTPVTVYVDKQFNVAGVESR